MGPMMSNTLLYLLMPTSSSRAARHPGFVIYETAIAPDRRVQVDHLHTTFAIFISQIKKIIRILGSVISSKFFAHT